MPQLEVRHYRTPTGRDPISKFLDGLPIQAAAKCTIVIGWLESGDLDRHPSAWEHIEGDIWELKARHDGEQYRFLYAIDEGVAYLLVPIHKKTQAVRRSDIDQAKARLSDLRTRRQGL